VTADAATCAPCRAETLDPSNRRYGYPFTNCTHCGPRLSIVRRIPYDRRHTSMAAFPMCADCAREYEDPLDRRFHAQPNACPACGPRIWLETPDGERTEGQGDAIDAIRSLLRQGRILAIKGIGGFHLACDATDEAAVRRLRERKRRYEKPFALMAENLAVIARYCRLEPAEAELLASPAAPIVLLRASAAERVADSVAPGQASYGFMLPYTPLHHLILHELGVPIVLTSGNVSEEPQCTDNLEARRRLGGIADAIVQHDRDIVNRLDDAVARVIDGRTQLLRRARGYAPAPLSLPEGFEQAPRVLALGGELKSTFCLLRDGQAVMSQHLGDLENPAAYAAYGEAIALYEGLFEYTPERLAVDLHPDYLSTKLGRERGAQADLPVNGVQHHHAHIAACLADNGVPLDAPPVLGIALDGLGFGADGGLWGGEFLLADYRQFRRLAAFRPVPMPGGAQAVREPWRMAYAYLRGAGDCAAWARRYAHLPYFEYLRTRPTVVLDQALEAGINCPVTSACGRLFDAVAAVTGLRQAVTYEAQGAMELEAAVDAGSLDERPDETGYTFIIERGKSLWHLDAKTLWPALLDDLDRGVPIGFVAARFHAGLTQALAKLIRELTDAHDNPWQGRVALSGGVFQNAVISAGLRRRLEASGFEVFAHRQVPPNDGGLSLGQAAVAAARAVAARG
nr:carbamoyltransferase HypF [Gammaproteobacteria bacterium]